MSLGNRASIHNHVHNTYILASEITVYMHRRLCVYIHLQHHLELLYLLHKILNLYM